MLQAFFGGSNLVGKRGCFSGSDLIFCSMLTEDEHSLDCFNEDDAGFPNNHDFLLEKHLLNNLNVDNKGNFFDFWHLESAQIEMMES